MTRSPVSVPDVAAAASAIADRDGFDRVSVSAVARALGVRPPSLYAHVRDLAALRDLVSAVALAALADAIAADVAGRAGADALRGLAGAHRRFAVAHPGGWASLQRRMGGDDALVAAGRRVTELTRAVLRGYDLPESEHVHAVRLVGATIGGYLEIEARGGFEHSRPGAESSWARALDALDSLLTHWPDPTETQ